MTFFILICLILNKTVSHIYSTELQLNKVNFFYTETPHVLTLACQCKWHSFILKYTINEITLIFILHFWMKMILTLIPMVYVFPSLFVLQESALMLVTLTIETKYLTAMLLKQCYKYLKLHRVFSQFYHRHYGVECLKTQC